MNCNHTTLDGVAGYQSQPLRTIEVTTKRTISCTYASGESHTIRLVAYATRILHCITKPLKCGLWSGAETHTNHAHQIIIQIQKWQPVALPGRDTVLL